jgi:hypothetical protein
MMKAMIVREFNAEKIIPVLAGAFCGTLFAMISGAFQAGMVA